MSRKMARQSVGFMGRGRKLVRVWLGKESAQASETRSSCLNQMTANLDTQDG